MSIDLDPPAPGSDAVYAHALPRLVELLDEVGVRATFFATGRDASRPLPARALRALADAGHEIGNHTEDHLEDFSRRSPSEKRAQIIDAEEHIAEAIGARPRGFRAPGWEVDATTLSILEAREYLYDSSVVPTPLTPLLRRVARLRGTRSHLFGDPRLAIAPVNPYHPAPGAPWRPGRARLVELPSCVGLARLPVWFTLAASLGPASIGPFHALLAAMPAPQWLLHGTDLLRSAEAPAARRRPGSRRPLSERTAMIRALLARFVDRFQVVPLCELAVHHA